MVAENVLSATAERVLLQQRLAADARGVDDVEVIADLAVARGRIAQRSALMLTSFIQPAELPDCQLLRPPDQGQRVRLPVHGGPEVEAFTLGHQPCTMW